MKKEGWWKVLRIVMDIVFYILIIIAIFYLNRFLNTYKTDPCSLCQNLTNKICVDVMPR
jgi:hypothetical protein